MKEKTSSKNTRFQLRTNAKVNQDRKKKGLKGDRRLSIVGPDGKTRTLYLHCSRDAREGWGNIHTKNSTIPMQFKRHGRGMTGTHRKTKSGGLSVNAHILESLWGPSPWTFKVKVTDNYIKID
jgi:hypothetical protein